MSNLSDDTLRKILTQIQNQAITSQRALSLVRSQIQTKEKDRKILQLTIRELGAVPKPGAISSAAGDGAEGAGKTYKGVGKMFVYQPRAEVDRAHEKQEKELGEEIANLVKKARYLEKQINEAESQLKDIVQAIHLES